MTVIVAAKRSPIGAFNGGLFKIQLKQMSTEVLKSLQMNVDLMGRVILGHVLTSGFGQNTARQVAINAGVPEEITAYTVNQVCGSGMKAIILGCTELNYTDKPIVIAGGHEMMSHAPHNVFLRNKSNFGNLTLNDSIVSDGLTDVFNLVHMGITAENLAKEYDISRATQDEYAYLSQFRASNAQINGIFKDEITIIHLPNGTDFAQDEFIRHDTSIDKLSKLKPAFLQNETGTVTAGNSSGINDGSAMVALMKQENAIKLGIQPLAKIVSFAEVGVNPMRMGIGPVPASKKALDLAGWSINDLDLIEVNEAFAAQTIAVNKLMQWNTEKVNVNGGAIALGHPIGASGARIVVTLIHELRRRHLKRGLATACIGGGMGIAMCIEVCD